jgi:hypothetical protein
MIRTAKLECEVGCWIRKNIDPLARITRSPLNEKLT